MKPCFAPPRPRRTDSTSCAITPIRCSEATRSLTSIGLAGERVELPDSALEALRVIIETMAQGRSITLIPHDKELTSQEAADILHVSRPHLIKLLDRGELPFYLVGTHRRIRVEDVLAYCDRRGAERDAARRELTRLSEELPGGYR